MTRRQVVIVGGGPAGLTAAAALAPSADVVVLEREAVAGGIPRHSHHLGYGMRDLHRFISGPAYARRLVAAAQRAGASIRTNAMATGWTDDGGLEVTSPEGRTVLEADAVVLATGARERPRSARLVPGDRPAGVLTTGQLQNLVHLHAGTPGHRAVVVGAELVSWSAVMTLRAAGCRTVMMTTVHHRPESYLAFTLAGRFALHTRVATRTRVVRIIGAGRVSAVEIEDLDSGARRVVECDTVVFTGDWIPDNELARAGGLSMDAGSSGPVVDSALRTSHDGIFAAGNLVHPVETADLAALGGRHVATQVLAHLAGARAAEEAIRIRAVEPFRWVSPAVLRPGDPAPVRVTLWLERMVRRPHVIATQDGRTIADLRMPRVASPGRAFHLPQRIFDDIDYLGGDVSIGLSSG
jgi:thioredoxin reductase